MPTVSYRWLQLTEQHASALHEGQKRTRKVLPILLPSGTGAGATPNTATCCPPTPLRSSRPRSRPAPRPPQAPWQPPSPCGRPRPRRHPPGGAQARGRPAAPDRGSCPAGVGTGAGPSGGGVAAPVPRPQPDPAAIRHPPISKTGRGRRDRPRRHPPHPPRTAAGKNGGDPERQPGRNHLTCARRHRARRRPRPRVPSRRRHRCAGRSAPPRPPTTSGGAT